jgi:hypothetical protein
MVRLPAQESSAAATSADQAMYRHRLSTPLGFAQLGVCRPPDEHRLHQCHPVLLAVSRRDRPGRPVPAQQSSR